MLKVILIVLVSIIYLDAIISFIDIFKAKTIEEFEEETEVLESCRLNNRILRYALITIRLPLLIVMFIPLYIHINKIYK